MGADPVTLAIAGGTVMGATSASGALSQNRSIGRAMKSTVAASQDAMNQIQARTAIAAQRFVNDARQVRAQIRVAGAAGGVRGSDLAAIVRQNAYDADLNTRLAKIESANSIASVRSNTEAQLERLKSQGRSVLVDTVQGGLRGAISGYSLGSFFSPASAADPALNIVGPNDLGAPTEFIA